MLLHALASLHHAAVHPTLSLSVCLVHLGGIVFVCRLTQHVTAAARSGEGTYFRACFEG